MLKKARLAIFICLLLTLTSCAIRQTIFQGAYQSEWIGNDIVQMTVNPKDSTFVLYMTNRQVDSGSVEAKEENVYSLNGSYSTYEITLDQDNSFEIYLPEIAGEEPIIMNNVNATSVYIHTEPS